MKLEKFLGSKTKTDILKYLIFKEEGISLRALENVLKWSFPAIKKQVDILEDSGVVFIDKNTNGW
jgi:predicted transcriptional regulator